MSAATDSAEVVLVGQKLTTLPQDLVAKHGPTCEKLDLSENKISSGEWLTSFPRLKTLILDRNDLDSVRDWPKAPSVETLSINNNKVDDIRTFCDGLKRTFPSLTFLSIMRNPAAPDMYTNEAEAEAYQRFRYYVIHRLDKLECLDCTPVDDSERKDAQRKGHLMAPARPDTVSSAAAAAVAAAGGLERKSSVAGASGGPAAVSDSADSYSLKSLIDAKDTKVATFLVKSKPRYDGSNSEGNRFITNESL